MLMPSVQPQKERTRSDRVGAVSGETSVTFIGFCRAHGLIVDSLIRDRWVRVPTTDHPKRKNGAYKWTGSRGWCQNHAVMPEPASWHGSDSAVMAIDPRVAAEAAERERRRLVAGRVAAADKAHSIIAQAKFSQHAYLHSKGFPDALGLVWERDGAHILVVPMHVDRAVVGCQLIGVDGDKKFLTGQQTKGATFTIGQGNPVYCEGYATALSIHAALQAARLRRSVVACFSAHNLTYLAKRGVVVADNDASGTGQRAAEATGLPYWMSERVGEDFNDAHQRLGLFVVSQSLKATLMRRPVREAAPP